MRKATIKQKRPMASDRANPKMAYLNTNDNLKIVTSKIHIYTQKVYIYDTYEKSCALSDGLRA